MKSFLPPFGDTADNSAPILSRQVPLPQSPTPTGFLQSPCKSEPDDIQLGSPGIGFHIEVSAWQIHALLAATVGEYPNIELIESGTAMSIVSAEAEGYLHPGTQWLAYSCFCFPVVCDKDERGFLANECSVAVGRLEVVLKNQRQRGNGAQTLG